MDGSVYSLNLSWTSSLTFDHLEVSVWAHESTVWQSIIKHHLLVIQCSFAGPFFLCLFSCSTSSGCLIFNISFIHILATVVIKFLYFRHFRMLSRNSFLSVLFASFFAPLIVSFLDFYFCSDAFWIFCSLDGSKRKRLEQIVCGFNESQHEKFYYRTRKGLQQSYHYFKAARLLTFDTLPWKTFSSPFSIKQFSGSFFCSVVLSVGHFKLFSGALAVIVVEIWGKKSFNVYLRINSRRSPDVNECTLWILCASACSDFCVFRLLSSHSHRKFIDIINIIWNFDNIFSVIAKSSLSSFWKLLLRRLAAWKWVSIGWRVVRDPKLKKRKKVSKCVKIVIVCRRFQIFLMQFKFFFWLLSDAGLQKPPPSERNRLKLKLISSWLYFN